MSASRGAGRSVEVRLAGYVTLQDVCAHVGDIWRTARQHQGVVFAVDCAAVIDFSTLALTALGRLRKHLREFGCELVLVRCSPSVLERKDEPVLADLMTAQPLPEPVAPPAEAAPAEAVKPAAKVFNRVWPRPTTQATAAPRPRKDEAHDGPMPHHVRLLTQDFQRYWLN